MFGVGSFSLAGGVPIARIARRDDADWSPLGTGLSAQVMALAADGSNLYAGGSFLKAGTTTVNRIAQWDGTNWLALGTGMNSDVNTLAISANRLYAGAPSPSPAGQMPIALRHGTGAVGLP